MADFFALKREARSASTPPERLLELAELEPQLSRVVARSIHTPPVVLAELAQSLDAKTRQYVAEHPATLPQILVALAGDRAQAVQSEVDRNPNTPETAQVELYGLGVSSIRKALADKRPVPAGVQRLFAVSEDWQERLLMAQCHDLIPQLLPLLAGDERAEIREALAFYHAGAVSQPFLNSFATHANASLRGRVARHSRDLDILRELAQDSEAVIAEMAKQNPHYSP